MKNKIVRTYTAPTEGNYDEILKTILECGYNVDISTDIKNLKISLAFNEEDTATQEEMSGVAKELNLTVTYDKAVSVFTEWIETDDTIVRIREEVANELKSLSKERDNATREKEYYCHCSQKAKDNLSRIKVQIKAISALLSSLSS